MKFDDGEFMCVCVFYLMTSISHIIAGWLVKNKLERNWKEKGLLLFWVTVP